MCYIFCRMFHISSNLNYSRYCLTFKKSFSLLNSVKTASFISSSYQENVSKKFSRLPRSWFKSKRRAYDVVDLYDVSPKRSVPDHILKPDYADSGIANESDFPEILAENQLKYMKQSCGLAKFILDQLEMHVCAGISTDELDSIAHSLCLQYGAYPSPLNYKGFPKSICTSVNNIACHGVPNSRKLKEGDIISIDISVYYKGFHGDCASTYCVGQVDENGKTLVEVTLECLNSAIKLCHHGQNFCQIGKTISLLASNQGYSVIPAFCGHGIGLSFHSPPNILHYDNDNPGQMQKGMIFTIEPVICEGEPDILILNDGWSATSEDYSRSAQFEHTILINETGTEILTLASNFEHE